MGVCGQMLDEPSDCPVKALVDFVDEAAKLFWRIRIMARVRGVHVGPVIVLRPIKHGKDDHKKIPLALTDQKAERLISQADRAAEQAGATMLIRQSLRLY